MWTLDPSNFNGYEDLEDVEKKNFDDAIISNAFIRIRYAAISSVNIRDAVT